MQPGKIRKLCDKARGQQSSKTTTHTPMGDVWRTSASTLADERPTRKSAASGKNQHVPDQGAWWQAHGS